MRNSRLRRPPCRHYSTLHLDNYWGLRRGETLKWTKSGHFWGYHHGCPTTRGQAASIMRERWGVLWVGFGASSVAGGPWVPTPWRWEWVAIHLKTDKSQCGSQPEAKFLTLPWKEWGWIAPGRYSGTSGCSAYWAPGSRAHKKIYLVHLTQTSAEGVPKGTPNSETEDSQHGSAWERTGHCSRRAIRRSPDGGVSIFSIQLHYKQWEWPKSTITLKMTKSEDGVEFSKCRSSGTLEAHRRSCRSGVGEVE